MIKASLIFLVKDNKVLLAMKKRGFGEGKWNGVGGKKNQNETIQESAKREANEEIGVKINKLKKVAFLSFKFLEKAEWNQHVTIYLSTNWSENPKETEEMALKWFLIDKIPYDQMWDDDILWLPKVLDGKIVEGHFLFDENQKMLEHEVVEVA